MAGAFLEDDLPIFTNTDDFGVTATWTPTDGNPTSVDGQFFDLNMQINPFTGTNNTTTDAIFVCSVSDTPGIKQGEPMVIDGTNYEVKIVPSSTSNYMRNLGINRA